MQPRDEDALREVAQAIADGRAVPWSALESKAEGVAPAVLKELQVLATLADLHRTADIDPTLEVHGDTPTPAPLQWGPFEIKEELGRGSFGTVYRARDPRLDRDVALKLVPSSDPDGADRIVAEGRRMARVRHPAVVTVFGADVFDGEAGIWMDLLEGRTLHDEVRERGPFGAREAALVGIDLCQALAAVHRAGVVHRDVKTQNVIREAGGRIVLMDFGAGREMARPDRQAGTPLYMAPEVLSGVEATAHSDLYSLGVLLFYLVTGGFPVTASSLEQLEAAHASGTRRRLRDVRPDLPPSFIRAVERAAAPNPTDRPPSAAALEQDLEAVVLGRDPHRNRAGGAWALRSWIMLLTALLVLVSLAGWNAGAIRHLLAPASTGIRSLAVLPFANLTGSPDQEYLADGVTQLLIGDLAQLRSLRVTSRTSSMAYKGVNKPLSTIAAELGTDGIVEGSIERSGDRLRVSVRLVRADDSHVWGHTYERPADDLFKLRSDIAGMIAGAIRLSLTEDEQRGLDESPGVALQAQEAFLRGLYRLNDLSPEGIKAAHDALTEAVRLDPRSARAHAMLSQSYLLMETREFLSRDEAYTMALAAATRAIQLDDRVSDAHSQLAEVKFYYEWNWEWARREYELALELNPNNSQAMARYSQFLSALGRSEEAIRWAQLAQQLDPMSPGARSAPGMAYFYARQYDESIAAFERLAEIPPYALTALDRIGLARAYVQRGRFGEAEVEIETAMKQHSRLVPWLAELALVHIATGNTVEAERILADLREHRRGAELYPANLAFVYIALGDLARAFQHLDIAAKQRSPTLLWAHVDPRLDPVRDDPRFRELVERNGLPY